MSDIGAAQGGLESPLLEVPKEHLEVPKEHLEVPKEHLDMPKEHLEVPKEHLDMPKEHLEVPKEHLDVTLSALGWRSGQDLLLLEGFSNLNDSVISCTLERNNTVNSVIPPQCQSL
ncbi:hypothetical protein TURU_092880 [Turdus rufiventris]|nr:hypothetical protein TURU_092880 [Turdus rufiventris]